MLSTLVLSLKITNSLILGLLTSIIIFLLNNNNLIDLLSLGIYGFHPLEPSLSAILQGGGLLSMKTVLLVVIISTGLTGILQGANLISPFIHKVRKHIHSQGNLLLSSIYICVGVCLLTCSQALTILIPAQYLGPIYDEFSLDRKHLVRTIADTGIIIVPIIPWNLNAIMVTSLLGVKPIEYVPYSFMCLLLPMTSIIYYFIKRRNLNEN